MKYKVNYTESSKRDLRGIYEYIANHFIEPETAADLTRRIQDDILKLDENPERYKVYDEEPWKSQGLRYFPVDNYEIFYVVKEYEVDVVRIMYGGMDIGKQLRRTLELK